MATKGLIESAVQSVLNGRQHTDAAYDSLHILQPCEWKAAQTRKELETTDEPVNLSDEDFAKANPEYLGRGQFYDLVDSYRAKHAAPVEAKTQDPPAPAPEPEPETDDKVVEKLVKKAKRKTPKTPTLDEGSPI